MKRTKTTYYVTHGGVEFSLPCEPIDGSEIVRIVGDKAVVGYLSDYDDAESPREDDNLGTMACFHDRHNLGDKDVRRNREAGGEFLRRIANEAVRFKIDPYYVPDEHIWRAMKKHYVILPLALYDHSGLTMRVGSGPSVFDPGGWDSGQIGWIYCSLKDAASNWSVNPPDWDAEIDDWDDDGKNGIKITLRAATERLLRSEVEEYDSFLRGEVYGVCYAEFDRLSESTVDADGLCRKCGRQYDPTGEHHPCPADDCPSRLDDEWEQSDADECWGYIGENWAKKELADGMEVYAKRYATPADSGDTSIVEN